MFEPWLLYSNKKTFLWRKIDYSFWFWSWSEVRRTRRDKDHLRTRTGRETSYFRSSYGALVMVQSRFGLVGIGHPSFWVGLFFSEKKIILSVMYLENSPSGVLTENIFGNKTICWFISFQFCWIWITLTVLCLRSHHLLDKNMSKMRILHEII